MALPIVPLITAGIKELKGAFKTVPLTAANWHLSFAGLAAARGHPVTGPAGNLVTSYPASSPVPATAVPAVATPGAAIAPPAATPFVSGGNVFEDMTAGSLGSPMGFSAIGTPGIAGDGSLWGSLLGLGSAALGLLAPQTIPGLPGLGGITTTGVEKPLPGTAVPQIAINALAANCATSAGLGSLPCVTHQGGPYKGQMVKHSRRRHIKLMNVGGQLTPVICCTKPRMNPMNVHALRRAARRLGSFQKIAHNVDKMITHQLKRRGARSVHSAVGFNRSQFGKRQRCCR